MKFNLKSNLTCNRDTKFLFVLKNISEANTGNYNNEVLSFVSQIIVFHHEVDDNNLFLQQYLVAWQ